MTTSLEVATALTVYGIETLKSLSGGSRPYTLQQPLPFTVLKLSIDRPPRRECHVATALTVYGIETTYEYTLYWYVLLGCNSPYRLRY